MVSVHTALQRKPARHMRTRRDAMAQSPTYLLTLSATTFDGIAATLGTTAPWCERCDTTAKLVIAALHDVHPDKVDVVQVDVTRPNGGASIAYRVAN